MLNGNIHFCSFEGENLYMKCSMITIHHIHNFGSVFQGYGLYQFLKTNGFDVEIIDYRPSYYTNGKNKLKSIIGKLLNWKAYTTRKRKFENFIQEYDGLSRKQFVSFEQLADYYQNKDHIFIAGGDQLWNNYHPCGEDPAYKLSFASGNRKIAYGTSMGRDNFSNEELKHLAGEVKDFQHIMLREKCTVPLLQQYSDVPVSHVIDPVGLLDIADFEKIAVKPDIKEPYAVMYLADSSELLDESIELLSHKMGLKIVHICGFSKKCYCDTFAKDVGPEEILGYILHADFVLSASFHATMFSILFNKQFATLLPGTKTNARIEDVLKYVDLENRILRDAKDLKCLEEMIEFSSVNIAIEKWRSESRKLLLEILNKQVEEV